MKILVVNIGTTSLKYRLYDMASGAVMAKGLVERIGQAGNCPNYAGRDCAVSGRIADWPGGTERDRIQGGACGSGDGRATGGRCGA